MKKMKFYLMALLVAMVAFVSCEPEPEPPVNPPTPQDTTVELKMVELGFLKSYDGGNYEQYYMLFEDVANANKQYYAELVSYGNEKKGPQNGKYTLKETESVVGDLMLVFERTIIEGVDTLELEAEKIEFQVTTGEILINANYPDGTTEKLTWKGEYPAVQDIPGLGEPQEVVECDWTINAANIQFDPSSGMFYVILLDTVNFRGAQIAGWAFASYAQSFDEATGTSSLTSLPAATYQSMSFMDFYNAASYQGYAYDAIFSGNYLDVMQGALYTIIFDGIERDKEGDVDFKTTYWMEYGAMAYIKGEETSTIEFEALSYHGSSFHMMFEGEVEEELMTEEAAPKKLAPKAQQNWGTLLLGRKALNAKPMVRF